VQEILADSLAVSGGRLTTRERRALWVLTYKCSIATAIETKPRTQNPEPGIFLMSLWFNNSWQFGPI